MMLEMPTMVMLGQIYDLGANENVLTCFNEGL
jgi:hypothetical protein